MPIRYLLVFGTFLLSILLYVDRICISVAKDDVATDLGFTNVEMGWVLSAFGFGYAAFQVPGGMLADRFGPRAVMTSIVAIWSAFTAFTGLARHYVSMLVVRFLFGAGEAGAYPTIARAFYSWLPVSERGLAQGINFSGSRIGAAVAVPFVAWLVTSYGWERSFVILGVLGVGIAILWYVLFRNTPETHFAVSTAEREHIVARRQEKASDADEGPAVGLRALFSSRNGWLLMTQYFASNFTFFFALSWMIPHLKDTYSDEFTARAWLAMLPFVCGALGNWVAGSIVDALYRRSRLLASRRAPAMIGFALAAGGMIGLVHAGGAVSAILWLCVAIFGADMTLSPSWSACIDIGGRSAGMVSGSMNMAGNIGSSVTSLAFPYFLLWSGSHEPFFYTAAGLNVLAILLWLGVRSDRPLGGAS